MERHSDSPPLNPTSWWADLRALARNPSFILSSLGFTAVAFVTGSLALWAPAFLLRSRVVLGETPPCLPGDSCSSSDSLIFGLITCLTGVLGVGLGVEISRRLRRSNPGLTRWFVLLASWAPHPSSSCRLPVPVVASWPPIFSFLLERPCCP